MKKLFRILICTTSMATAAQSGPALSNDTTITAIFEAIYNFQFQKARLQLENSKHQLSPAIYRWLETENEWWQLLSGKDSSLAKHLENKWENRRKNLRCRMSANKKGPWEDCFTVFVYDTYLLRLHSMRHRWRKAAETYLRLRNEWKYLQHVMPSSYRYSEIFSVYNATLVSVQHKFIPWIFDTQPLHKSLKELEKIAREGNTVSSTLALYALVKIHTSVIPDTVKARTDLEILVKRFPHNTVLQELRNEIFPPSSKNRVR